MKLSPGGEISGSVGVDVPEDTWAVGMLRTAPVVLFGLIAGTVNACRLVRYHQKNSRSSIGKGLALSDFRNGVIP